MKFSTGSYSLRPLIFSADKVKFLDRRYSPDERRQMLFYSIFALGVFAEVKDGEKKLGAKNETWYGFEVENPVVYRYYKLVLKNKGTMQIADIRLLGEE